MPSIYAVAALLATLWYAILFLYRRRSKDRLPPGPAGLPLVGSLPSLDPELHSYFAKLAATYGHVFSIRLGRKLGIVVSSPAAAREVLRDKDALLANRDVPAAGLVIAYGGSDIVWTPDGPTWRMLRRVCVQQMLSGASLDAAYGLRRQEMHAAVEHLRATAEAEEAVNVGAQMFLTTMNVITSAMWGGVLGGEEDREETGREFRELVMEITQLLGAPNLSDFFPAMKWMDLQGIERRMKKLKVKFDDVFAKMIERRRGVGGGQSDFLEVLLKLEKEEGDGKSKTPFTMTHVKALLMDMVVGGTETTSNTVEWAVAEMMNKPEILKKAQDELDVVVGRGNTVEEYHLSKLPYLNAVIKEVLRLHPALPLLVPHCPRNSSCDIQGYAIPQGSRVFVNVWAIHRDPSIWDDPLEFKPERFLLDPAKGSNNKWDYYSGNDLHYFPFGSGRRICAGIAMADRMVGYSLATLVHLFDWKLPEGTKLNMDEKFGIVLKKAEPLIVIPTQKN